MPRNILYIFLHIPKTAGSTFIFHLLKNFRKEELLHLSFEKLGLSLDDPVLSPRVYKKAVAEYFSNNLEGREKIKVIYGHAVPFGVHKYFGAQAKYITFIRDPELRLVSIYNHKRRLCDGFSKLDPGRKKNIKNTLLINDKTPSFETWIEKKYDSGKLTNHLSVYGYLKMLGYLEGVITVQSIKKDLGKFWFLGLTENFNSDSLFLYSQLGINKFFFDQNVSRRNYASRLSTNLRKKISKKTVIDREIYDLSKELHKKFIVGNKDYEKAVKKKKIQRFLTAPFTQVVFSPMGTLRYLKSII